MANNRIEQENLGSSLSVADQLRIGYILFYRLDKEDLLINDLGRLRRAFFGHQNLRQLIADKFGKTFEKGTYINLPQPGNEIQNFIRFFDPQIPLDISKPQFIAAPIIPKAFTDGAKNIYLPQAFMGSPSWNFIQKAWTLALGFGSEFLNARIQETHPSPTLPEMRVRLAHNLNNLFDALVTGYLFEKRRTGEAQVAHPVRVFLRVNGESTKLKHDEKAHWIVYTSYLVSLLHDAKEDFTKFALTKNEASYEISFALGEQTYTYPLELTNQEADLLNMQIGAITVPEEATKEDLPDEEKAKIQFEHLVKTVQGIEKRFGPLAAYYTILIKVADRFDNICTYWPFSKQVEERERLRKKLTETLIYFPKLEKLTQAYAKKIDQKALNSVLLNFQSVIDLCYYILMGASYDEIFIMNLIKLRQELEEEDRELGHSIPNLLRERFTKLGLVIPEINPQFGYTTPSSVIF